MSLTSRVRRVQRGRASVGLRPSAARVTAACGFALAACAMPSAPPAGPEPSALPPLVEQVEIRRTSHGVPHILAENLQAAAFALAYVQLEDHGLRILRDMEAERGRMALIEGITAVDEDAVARLSHARAIATFDSLQADTRAVYTGFAEGMNHYIRVHRAELPPWVRPDYAPYDVLARDIVWPSSAAMGRFRRRLVEDPDDPHVLTAAHDSAWQQPQNVGSNAWALAPSRTASGKAILLRNPHLSWTAGYYEAHVRVPGELDFYGDFRIGGPFTVIGGFNARLGFATTNNDTRPHAFYAFRLHPTQPDHIVLDDMAVPLERDIVTVEYRAEQGVRTARREFWSTPYGPVVHRSDSLVYVYRLATSGAFRAGERWLDMMKAKSLAEWKEAMRIQPRDGSNFTYADADGNIFFVWEAPAPLLPHADGGDTLAVLATRAEQVWTRLVPFDSLPQLHNPPGGYIHNENDSPHYTSLSQVLPHSFRFWVEPPRLRLRSQHALQLLHNERVFTLEDVVAAKHSMRMLLADRVKPALVAAVRRSGATGATARASELLHAWDNTAARDSRGGVLFQTWWERYRALVDEDDVYEVAWSAAEPTSTPRGLGAPERAVDAFHRAVDETARQFGSWDVAWGEVHRVRRGDVDVPVGGCGGALGCFRVLNFDTAPDGKRYVNGGDGWVLAVELGEIPRAYSVLAYGQSPDPDSPWHDDQAAMFADNRMKVVRWTEQDIAADIVVRYRPGEEVPGTRQTRAR